MGAIRGRSAAGRSLHLPVAAPAPNRRKTAWVRWTGAALLSCLLFAVLHPVHAADSAREEARLQKLRARIGALQEKLNETRGQRDAVREEIRDLERRIGGLLQSSRQTETRQRRNERKLQNLRAQAARERGGLETQRQQLGRQIRAAYVMGRREYPKMLLNQENPAGVARVLTYYQYLNRARTERITDIQAGLSRLESLERQIREVRAAIDALFAKFDEPGVPLGTKLALLQQLYGLVAIVRCAKLLEDLRDLA